MSEDLSRIDIVFGAVPNAREGHGWIPMVMEDGRIITNQWSSIGWDKEQALEQAREKAEDIRGRYIGDWHITFTELPKSTKKPNKRRKFYEPDYFKELPSANVDKREAVRARLIRQIGQYLDTDPAPLAALRKFDRWTAENPPAKSKSKPIGGTRPRGKETSMHASTDELRDLRREAERRGDQKMAHVADRALAGSKSALKQALSVMANEKAQELDAAHFLRWSFEHGTKRPSQLDPKLTYEVSGGELHEYGTGTYLRKATPREGAVSRRNAKVPDGRGGPFTVSDLSARLAKAPKAQAERKPAKRKPTSVPKPKNGYRATLSSIKSRHKHELVALKSTHGLEILALKDRHHSELEDMKARHKREIANAEKAHELLKSAKRKSARG